jgi:chemotaxis protein methyltransferase CheR
MKDTDCVAFLRWALPRMGLKWAAFRKVRKLVCKRIDRRCASLGVGDVASYRQRIEATPAEWDQLRTLCSIPVSRFYRDRAAFTFLDQTALPALAHAAAARGQRSLECWSAGCASGEEAYTLSIMWRLSRGPQATTLKMHILATDIDKVLLERAATACYHASSLRELPQSWRNEAFEIRTAQYCLREWFRTPVTFVRQDLCTTMPSGPFDLILCRNDAFTYFESSVQQLIARRLAARLNPGGILMIGLHEELPAGITDLVPWPGVRAVFCNSPVAAVAQPSAVQNPA